MSKWVARSIWVAASLGVSLVVFGGYVLTNSQLQDSLDGVVDRGEDADVGGVGPCAVASFNYPRALALSVGRTTSPGASPEKVLGLLELAVNEDRLDSVPAAAERDARKVLSGIQDALDGEISDDDFESYVSSYENLRVALEEVCS